MIVMVDLVNQPIRAMHKTCQSINHGRPVLTATHQHFHSIVQTCSSSSQCASNPVAELVDHVFCARLGMAIVQHVPLPVEYHFALSTVCVTHTYSREELFVILADS